MDASHESEYENLIYACRFCNRSRAAKPLRHDAASLLDPTRDAWAMHFSAVDDHLRPGKGNADAQYTHKAYALDDPRKTSRRRARRDLITDRLRLLTRLENEMADLLKRASVAKQHGLRMFGEILQEIKGLRSDARRSLEDLKRYAAVPRDAPETCRCTPPRHLSLPDELERQTIDVADVSI